MRDRELAPTSADRKGVNTTAASAAKAAAVASFALVFAAAPAAAQTAPRERERFSHAEWTAVLERFVDKRGRVDYEGLARDRAGLDAWLARLARQGPKSTPSLFPSRNENLAYYLNAYNALVFQGVLSRGPEKESVWKGGLFSGTSFFVSTKVRLDAQLDAAMREFGEDERNVAADPARQTVTLSKIFDWFEKGFLSFERERGNADPKSVDYVNRFRVQKPRLDRSFRVRYFDYDKGINGR